MACCRTDILLGERQKRITLRAAQLAPGMLTEKKHDEAEDQAKADREGEGDDGHGRRKG
jgi:hypothetical protein